MIFWSAELFVRAAGITAVGLLGAMAASIPASSPARAQDGPVVVNCFDEAHETVKRIPAKDCKGRAISAAEAAERSEEHTSELQSLMRISYAVFCLKKKTQKTQPQSRKRKNTQ